MILPNKLKKECVFELTANPETLVLIFPQKIMSGTYTIYPLDSVVNTNNKIAFCIFFFSKKWGQDGVFNISSRGGGDTIFF